MSRFTGWNKPGATAAKGKSKQNYQELGRLKSGEMNKTEVAYERYLSILKMEGKVLWYAFEPITIRLARKTTYKIDFLVQFSDGSLEAHEVKGFWTDDARVKIKIAAEKLPIFQFVSVRLVKGAWEYERF